MGNGNGQTLSLTSGNSGGDITIGDAATSEELMNPGAHDSWITAVAFHPDDRYNTSADYGSTIRIWSSDPH